MENEKLQEQTESMAELRSTFRMMPIHGDVVARYQGRRNQSSRKSRRNRKW
ncbi:MAG: hypothetical protein ACLR2O_10840 [Coprococcus sp.]